MVLKFFESLDSVAEYIEKEENEKGVKYIRQSVAKYFGSENWTDRIAGKEVMWADRDPEKIANDEAITFSGIPYMVLGRRVLVCCCGVLRQKKHNDENYDNGYNNHKKKYKKIQTTRKQSCLAKIVIKELIYFLDFSIPADTKVYRRNQSSVLRSTLQDDPAGVRIRRCFVARLPDISEHHNHVIGPLLASCLPTDKRVIAKMKELTRNGVRHVPEMQLLIRDFVCNVLFAGQSQPPRFDSRFWPSNKTVRNCIYSTRMRARRVISSVAVQQPEPASAQPTLPRCDNNIEHLEQDIQEKSLTQSSQPGVVPVTDLTESTTDDQMAVDIKCQDDQFDHFEEVQESGAARLEAVCLDSSPDVSCVVDNSEILTSFFHEDDRCVAFHDVHPQAPIHFIVISKQPIGQICHCNEADKQLLGHMLVVAERIVRELAAEDTDEYRVVINNDLGHGQAGHHPQIHILAGRKLHWPPG